jgi:hypothetical protein
LYGRGRRISSGLPLVGGLFCQEGDAGADEESGEPAATVDVFLEEDLGGCSVADVGEGGAGGGGKGDVHVAEGEEEGEEAERHGEDAK